MQQLISKDAVWIVPEGPMVPGLSEDPSFRDNYHVTLLFTNRTNFLNLEIIIISVVLLWLEYGEFLPYFEKDFFRPQAENFWRF